MLGVLLTCVLVVPAAAQCPDPVIIVHENDDTRPSASLCTGQTHRFDEVEDFPQGSPCPLLINRFIIHVTEVGTAPPGLAGEPCCGLGDEATGNGCATGLSCASGICAVAGPIPALSTWAFILLAMLLAMLAVRALRTRRTFS